MRISIVIDDELMTRAMASSGLATKKAVIEEALRTLIRLKTQQEIRQWRGQLRWEGDLNEMREGGLIAVQ